MSLSYNHTPLSKTYNLKVICKERWGDEIVAKCKVNNNKDWYLEIYITLVDLQSGRVRIIHE
jgi:hypothetical protein